MIRRNKGKNIYIAKSKKKACFLSVCMWCLEKGKKNRIRQGGGGGIYSDRLFLVWTRSEGRRGGVKVSSVECWGGGGGVCAPGNKTYNRLCWDNENSVLSFLEVHAVKINWISAQFLWSSRCQVLGLNFRWLRIRHRDVIQPREDLWKRHAITTEKEFKN